MNGRIYDPLLGRMLSADPTVTNPENPQNYNRYTYVLNNPLTLVDPSGFADERPFSQIIAEVWRNHMNAEGQRVLDESKATMMQAAQMERDYGTAGAFLRATPVLNVGADIHDFYKGETTSGRVYTPLEWGVKGVSVPATAAMVYGSAYLRLAAVENVVTTTVARTGPTYGTHVLDRMAERGITPSMVEKALEKGTPYWDPKNKVINRVLEGGFASGKDLLVGQNPMTGKITTVIRGTDLVRPRFQPLGK